MASDNRVKASAVLKNLTLDGQMDWTVEKFFATLKVRKELVSPDFNFYVPQINKTFTFALKVVRSSLFGCEFADFYLLNRNPEDLEMSAELNVGTLSSVFTAKVAKESHYWWEKSLTKAQLVANSSAGSLDICVKFSIFNNLKSTTVGHLDLADPNQSLYQSQQRLWTGGVLSDFTISCGSERFPCHKAILANGSDVFARLLSSKDWVENKRNLLQVKNFPPTVVKQMIEFIYTNRIQDGSQCSLELLLLADQFHLKGLIQLCESELSKKVTCQNVIEILRVVDKIVDAQRLKDFVIDFMANNMPTIFRRSDWKQIIARSQFLDAIEDPQLKK